MHKNDNLISVGKIKYGLLQRYYGQCQIHRNSGGKPLEVCKKSEAYFCTMIIFFKQLKNVFRKKFQINQSQSISGSQRKSLEGSENYCPLKYTKKQKKKKQLK